MSSSRHCLSLLLPFKYNVLPLVHHTWMKWFLIFWKFKTSEQTQDYKTNYGNYKNGKILYAVPNAFTGTVKLSDTNYCRAIQPGRIQLVMLGEGLSYFSPLMLFWPLIILKLWLFVESAEKMGIRQFMKRKSLSDCRSVEKISDERLRLEVQPEQTNERERERERVYWRKH